MFHNLSQTVKLNITVCKIARMLSLGMACILLNYNELKMEVGGVEPPSEKDARKATTCVVGL